jgi:hypothetical protein
MFDYPYPCIHWCMRHRLRNVLCTAFMFHLDTMRTWTPPTCVQLEPIWSSLSFLPAMCSSLQEKCSCSSHACFRWSLLGNA